MAADKVNSISVFLINGDFKKYEGLTVGGLSGPIPIEGGELFYRTNDDMDYPEWVKRFFVEEKLGKEIEKLKTKALSAVYFTAITKKEEIAFHSVDTFDIVKSTNLF